MAEENEHHNHNQDSGSSKSDKSSTHSTRGKTGNSDMDSDLSNATRKSGRILKKESTPVTPAPIHTAIRGGIRHGQDTSNPMVHGGGTVSSRGRPRAGRSRGRGRSGGSRGRAGAVSSRGRAGTSGGSRGQTGSRQTSVEANKNRGHDDNALEEGGPTVTTKTIKSPRQSRGSAQAGRGQVRRRGLGRLNLDDGYVVPDDAFFHVGLPNYVDTEVVGKLTSRITNGLNLINQASRCLRQAEQELMVTKAFIDRIHGTKNAQDGGNKVNLKTTPQANSNVNNVESVFSNEVGAEDVELSLDPSSFLESDINSFEHNDFEMQDNNAENQERISVKIQCKSKSLGQQVCNSEVNLGEASGSSRCNQVEDFLNNSSGQFEMQDWENTMIPAASVAALLPYLQNNGSMYQPDEFANTETVDKNNSTPRPKQVRKKKEAKLSSTTETPDFRLKISPSATEKSCSVDFRPLDDYFPVLRVFDCKEVLSQWPSKYLPAKEIENKIESLEKEKSSRFRPRKAVLKANEEKCTVAGKGIYERSMKRKHSPSPDYKSRRNDQISSAATNHKTTRDSRSRSIDSDEVRGETKRKTKKGKFENKEIPKWKTVLQPTPEIKQQLREQYREKMRRQREESLENEKLCETAVSSEKKTEDLKADNGMSPNKLLIKDLLPNSSEEPNTVAAVANCKPSKLCDMFLKVDRDKIQQAWKLHVMERKKKVVEEEGDGKQAVFSDMSGITLDKAKVEEAWKLYLKEVEKKKKEQEGKDDEKQAVSTGKSILDRDKVQQAWTLYLKSLEDKKTKELEGKYDGQETSSKEKSDISDRAVSPMVADENLGNPEETLNIVIENVYSGNEVGAACFEDPILDQNVNNILEQALIEADIPANFSIPINNDSALTEKMFSDYEEESKDCKDGIAVGVDIEIIE